MNRGSMEGVGGDKIRQEKKKEGGKEKKEEKKFMLTNKRTDGSTEGSTRCPRVPKKKPTISKLTNILGHCGLAKLV